MAKKTSAPKTASTTSVRPPIIVIMGHVDHGKSTLLDYIRKTNIVDKEAGGITQHLGAYEVIWKDDKKITFLDTPGHEAFSGMRKRGATVADIAILVVSAVEGVKPQTLEAIKIIKEAEVPFIVAFNKIDRPEAQINKVKQELAENEVFVEGYGGTIPSVPISAKDGTGIDELLDTILLVAEVEELTADASLPATGVVIESNLDGKRGASAILVITNGTMRGGDFIRIDSAVSPIRIFENFLGKPIKEAGPASAVRLYSLAALPGAGSTFQTYESKKAAEEEAQILKDGALAKKETARDTGEKTLIPVVLKTDVLGTLEAVEHELGKLANEKVALKFITSSVGTITEGDIKTALGAKEPLVIGFNVKIDKAAKDLAEAQGIAIHLFDIIYKATEMLADEMERRTPKIAVEETTGRAKILKVFNKVGKDKQIIGGGAVTVGTIVLGKQVKIIRHDNEVGRGKILELQQMKQKAKEVEAGKQFGAMIESKLTIAEGDVVECFDIVHK